jgi:hypothetical protein
VAHVKAHITWIDDEIAKLERDIDDHIDRHPGLKHDAQLLHSIPGIGNTTVVKVLAYAGDVRRFANAKPLAAFIGVTPLQRISGSSVKGRTMMSHTGHAQLRRALYMPGLVARRHNPVLKAFDYRLSAGGLAPKAVLGAVMRKLAHLIYGVINSGQPFDLKIAAPRLGFQDGISFLSNNYCSENVLLLNHPPLPCFLMLTLALKHNDDGTASKQSALAGIATSARLDVTDSSNCSH